MSTLRAFSSVARRLHSSHAHGSTCKGVVYTGPGRVEVQQIPSPRLFLAEQQRPCEHGYEAARSLFAPRRLRCYTSVIVKVVASCICGSDVHMLRGRTTAPAGLVFGHVSAKPRAARKAHALTRTGPCRRLPERSSTWAATWSLSRCAAPSRLCTAHDSPQKCITRSAISYRFRSTLPVDVARTASRAKQV